MRAKRGKGYTEATKPEVAVEQALVLRPEPLLQFFEFEHLPPHLQEVSKEFAHLAAWIEYNLPRNQERTVALRKLLEAKDCAVRSWLWKA